MILANTDIFSVLASLQIGPESGTGGLLTLFFALMIGHALGDFPLQGSFLASGKDRHDKMAHALGSPKGLWIYCLTAHSLIHGGAVWLITGSPILGFAEFAVHWIVDALKCEKVTNFHTDQALHTLTKIVFVVLIAKGFV